mmetsp:Transcript_54381/g.130281  ORF Transcript_54381/g.130281 Transcript_54381/m.130281 type:complete len:211 (-) Transcript_54381:180-812(-)
MPSLGGRLPSRLACCACSESSRAWFSCVSFIAEAWYMESSETVAIMRRVVVLMRTWKSLTRLASSSVSPRPSSAWARSRLARLLTSSSTRSFSRSCSFLSLTRSSSTCSLAARSSGSGSRPSSLRHRFEFSGASSSADCRSESARSSSSCDCSVMIRCSSAGIWGSFRRVTSTRRTSSDTCRSSSRISSSLRAISSSPDRSTACCMLHFS